MGQSGLSSALKLHHQIAVRVRFPADPIQSLVAAGKRQNSGGPVSSPARLKLNHGRLFLPAGITGTGGAVHLGREMANE